MQLCRLLLHADNDVDISAEAGTADGRLAADDNSNDSDNSDDSDDKDDDEAAEEEKIGAVPRRISNIRNKKKPIPLQTSLFLFKPTNRSVNCINSIIELCLNISA